MGSGAPRELQQSGGEVKELDAALSSRLTRAVEKLDSIDPEFKTARDDERLAQLSKTWNSKCVEIDGHMRALANVLINSHQLSLDMGCDGGGRTATPWMEETSMKFERLYLKLDEDGTVRATFEKHELASAPLDAVDYDWLEKVVVEWVVTAIDNMG